MRKVLIMIVFLLLSACQVESSAEENGQNKEIHVTNKGEEIILKEPPTRAISLNQHVTEIMLALGLEDRMVGTAFLDDVIHPNYKEAYEQVPVLADTYPSREKILEQEPDFIYGGWESAFQNNAAGSRVELKSFGISSYLHESSNMVNPELEDVFRDIRNIGTIFQEEEAAEQLIEEMTKEISQTQKSIPEKETTKDIFVYDSGEDAPLTAAQNIFNTLIETAGARNIFNGIEKGWATVSWEDVAKADPDEIIIIDYGDTSAKDKQEFLKNHPVMKRLTAVQEERFTIVPLSEASEGIRIPDALNKIVEGIY